MTDPLRPKPTDDALRDALLANESGVRNLVIMLRASSHRCHSASGRLGQQRIADEAADAIRILYNVVKEMEAAHAG